MMYCKNCGTRTIPLAGGGCGGFGSIDGCKKCNVVFHQTNGGFAPPMGGTTHEVDPLTTFFEMKLHLLENTHMPKQAQWSDKKGQWYWSEGYCEENHYRPNEASAKADHKKFVEAYEATMPGPIHCGRKAKPAGCGREVYRCRICHAWLGDGVEEPATAED